MKAKDSKKDDCQNIQVFVRTRPLNQVEKNVKSYSVIELPSHRELVVREKSNANHTRSFQLDRVFGPQSQQLEVYRSVVEPLLDQVMMGYNCTVFAYGQTGTGKTYTMEGGERRGEEGVSWESDPTSGLIPRALSQIFDKLADSESQGIEACVRVSFLELYNEEIFDLLSPLTDTSKLRLFEDVTRKGSVIIQGLEEKAVNTKSEVYKILEQGSEKRKTAETLMNAQSSRSHTVFTATVHIKETTCQGDEVIRIGKLNLVDLAGSENVGRSGAVDKRAREAGNINQSLLTLGRVMTCLVDRTSHIPYRESRLTRLLQDSLGGRTKTSIIATVSPAAINLEETLSTLDYAHRARNITNRPEVNQKLSKHDVIKEYSGEMDRLKRDLFQVRERNGVYIANENYLEMLDKIQANEILVRDMAKEMSALKEEMDRKLQIFQDIEKNMIAKSREIENTKSILSAREQKLQVVKSVLSEVDQEKQEHAYLVTKHRETEGLLGKQALKLVVTNDQADEDLKQIHGKLELLNDIDEGNLLRKQEFENKLTAKVKNMSSTLKRWKEEHRTTSSKIVTIIDSQLEEKVSVLTNMVGKIHQIMSNRDIIGSEILEKSSAAKDQGVKSLIHASKLVERSSSGNVSRNLEDEKTIKKMLNELADTLAIQAEALRQIADVVNNYLEVIKVKTASQIQLMLENLETANSLVKLYMDNTRKTSDKMAVSCTGINESHNMFKEALSQLQSAYQNHEVVVSKEGNTMDMLIEETKKKVDPLLDSFGNTEKVVNKCTREIKEVVNKEGSGLKGSLDEFVSTCETNNIYMTESMSLIEAKNSSMVSNLCSELNKLVVEVGLYQEGKNEAEDHKQEGNLMNQEGNLFEELSQIGNSDGKFSYEVDQMLASVSINSKETIDNMDKELRSLFGSVSSLFDDEIANYPSSGNTPVRVERQYPRFLASTSPHDRLLDRFRRQQENNTRDTVAQVKEVRISVTSVEDSDDAQLEVSADSGISSLYIQELKEYSNPVGPAVSRSLKKPEIFSRNANKS